MTKFGFKNKKKINILKKIKIIQKNFLKNKGLFNIFKYDCMTIKLFLRIRRIIIPSYCFLKEKLY